MDIGKLRVTRAQRKENKKAEEMMDWLGSWSMQKQRAGCTEWARARVRRAGRISMRSDGQAKGRRAAELRQMD